MKKQSDEISREELAKQINEEEHDDSEKSVSSEEALAKTIDYLNNPKNINFGTDLSMQEIKLIARVEIEAFIYNDAVKKKLVKIYKEIKVSKDRKGRAENIEIIKYNSMGDIMQGNMGMFAGLKNLFTPKP